ALKGLCDFGIAKDTDGFVCADAMAVRLMRDQASSPVNCLARTVFFFIASPPHTVEAPGSKCHSPSSHRAAEPCVSRKRHLPPSASLEQSLFLAGLGRGRVP